MKTRQILTLGAILSLSGAAFAANLAFDNASAYAYDSAWSTGSNGGIGWGAWNLVANPGAGFFIGDSTSNGTGVDDGLSGGVASDGDINTKVGPDPDTSGAPAPNLTISRSLGLFAATGSLSDARRAFTGGALGVGQFVNIDFDNGDPGGFGSFGIGFLNASGVTLFETNLTGGNPNYEYIDSSGSNSWAVTDGYEGLNLTFGISAPGQYFARLVRRDGMSDFISGNLLIDPDQDVTQIRIYNSAAGDFPAFHIFVNTMQVIPEPSTSLLVLSVVGLLHSHRRRRQ